MRKITKEHLESFREKDLLDYSRIVNQYFKRKWRFVFLLSLASCSVQNQVNKDDFGSIPKIYSACFYDKLDTIETQYNNQIYTRSLMKDFTNISNINYTKPICVAIQNDELFLKFEDTNKKEYVVKFYGKLYKRKFVFYTNYETITFPILFVNKLMDKYSIYLPANNEIIFEKHDVSEGMILFFGAGSSSTSNYKFKILKNE